MLTLTQSLRGRTPRHYVDGHSVPMWRDSPVLPYRTPLHYRTKVLCIMLQNSSALSCRTVRHYVDEQPDITILRSPILPYRILRHYRIALHDIAVSHTPTLSYRTPRYYHIAHSDIKTSKLQAYRKKLKSVIESALYSRGRSYHGYSTIGAVYFYKIAALYYTNYHYAHFYIRLQCC